MFKEEKSLKKKKLKRQRRSYRGFLIIFLFIGIFMLYKNDIIKAKIFTSRARTTIVGKGIFLQSYEKCFPKLKVSINIPESRFLSKTKQGYLFKFPKAKRNLEVVFRKPKVTIRGKGVFIQTLKPCRPRIRVKSI